MGGVRLGGSGGCERRSEAFVKIQKKIIWGGRGVGRGGPIRVGLGEGGGGSKVWGRWVTRGM